MPKIYVCQRQTKRTKRKGALLLGPLDKSSHHERSGVRGNSPDFRRDQTVHERDPDRSGMLDLVTMGLKKSFQISCVITCLFSEV